MSLPRNSVQTEYPATDKERFDQCIAMLKAYYDALEGRLGTTVGFLVVIVGWLVTSQSARDALGTKPSLLVLAIVTLLLVTFFYLLNVRRWVARWREVRASLDELGYVEPRYYARYDLPEWTWIVYFMPVAVLCGFIILFLLLAAVRRST